MSVSPVSVNRTRFDAEQEPDVESSEKPKERNFDFAGNAYAAVHLPHGLIAATTTARPTLATVSKDAADFESKLGRLTHDLSSPAMREWLAKHVAASKTGLSIGWKLGAIAVTLAVFKEKGAAALLLTADGLSKIMGGGEKVGGLVDDLKTFARQLAEEQAAAKAAHPDVVRMEHDLLDALSAGVKLQADLRKLAGT